LRDGSHLERVIAASAAASLLAGCPVDERTLAAGGAGEAGHSAVFAGAAGESSAGDGSSGDGGSTNAGNSGEGGSEPTHAGSSGAGGDGATGAGGSSGSAASGGSAGEPPSACAGAKCSCFGERGDECRDESCCEAPIVAGSDFLLGDGDDAVSATVAEHRLDRYEVTVGRFREFVESYTGAPHPESGQHPWVVASGWRSEWDADMPASENAFVAGLACGDGATFSLAADALDARPVNCVTWFEAFAFCAWDGARLPTEAEWEYAASGGALERIYPWGDDEPAQSTALFDASELALVGSKPGGAGLYRQLDLAGSVSEWVFDWFGPYPDPCSNCALADGGSERVVRGGSYRSDTELALRASARESASPDTRSPSLGFRCARDL
jgi:sulfatase modifying factor 1